MSKTKNTETMLTLTAAWIVFFILFKIKILLSLALLFALIGIFSNYLSGKITWVWLKFAHILGQVNARILLSVIFFFILTPIAFLFKITNKELLKLKRGAVSYYTDRNHEYTFHDMENTW
jgi:hypothetical protein